LFPELIPWVHGIGGRRWKKEGLAKQKAKGNAKLHCNKANLRAFVNGSKKQKAEELSADCAD
jgi:hypothetical protein